MKPKDFEVQQLTNSWKIVCNKLPVDSRANLSWIIGQEYTKKAGPEFIAELMNIPDDAWDTIIEIMHHHQNRWDTDNSTPASY